MSNSRICTASTTAGGTIRDAYIADETGKRIVDFHASNLHVVGYSEPVDQWIDLETLQGHLHSLQDQPDAIPYITSYYQRCWGFCLTHRQREKLTSGRYRVVIDADLKPGVFNYGELILPGEEDREILLSSYICHPSMGNNELSGPVVLTALAREIARRPKRRFGYRIIYVPETIGSIVYISKHLERLKQAIVAGFVVTCVGDERTYSYLASRTGKTLADRVAKHVLNAAGVRYLEYSFLDRGSDERQFCSPLVDLPVASVMRSKYGCYPEYHTSLDDLSLISPAGLAGSYTILLRCLDAVEANRVYCSIFPCEPQLSPRGLYPTLSTREGLGRQVRDMMNLIAYADGRNDLIEIADIIGCDVFKCAQIAERLVSAGVIELC